MTKETIIAQAAEAIIIRKGDSVIKRRIKKGYRIPELDEKLRKLRTRSEAKLLEKSSKLIKVPRVIKVDEKTKEIEMQFIEGKKLSESLDNLNNKLEIMEQVGEETAKLHDNDIIHSDLTTSNMILVEKASQLKNKKVPIKQHKKDLTVNSTSINSSGIGEREEPIKESKIQKSEPSSRGEVYLIDFGLGFISKRIEDKAVDLHLLKQALEAKHWQDWEKLFESFLKGYNPKDKTQILKQLEKVEARGRYRKNAQ